MHNVVKNLLIIVVSLALIVSGPIIRHFSDPDLKQKITIPDPIEIQSPNFGETLPIQQVKAIPSHQTVNTINETFNPYQKYTEGMTDKEMIHGDLMIVQNREKFTIVLYEPNGEEVQTLRVTLNESSSQGGNKFLNSINDALSNFYLKIQKLLNIFPEGKAKILQYRYEGKYNKRVNNQDIDRGNCVILTYTPLQDYILSKRMNKKIEDDLKIEINNNLPFYITLPHPDDNNDVKLQKLYEKLDELLLNDESNNDEKANIYLELSTIHKNMGLIEISDEYFELSRQNKNQTEAQENFQ